MSVFKLFQRQQINVKGSREKEEEEEEEMLLSAEGHSGLWRTSQGSDLLPLPPAERGEVGWFRFCMN